MRDLSYEGNENLASFGQFGLRVLTGSSVADETFVAIQAVEDSVVSSDLNAYNSYIGDTSITDLALAKGMVIYGQFENIVVSSGKVIAYKG